MANIQKYNSGQCKQLFNHYERKINDKGEYLKFSNQEIDTSKTYFNYNLHNNNLNQNEILKKRLSEVKCLNRSDVNIMCSWVITKPVEIDFDEQEKFFKESYNFLSQKYGQDNTISSYVHLDETTPHMHFSFIPVVRDKKKDILKVSAKELITKNHLKMFHQELDKHMQNVFKRDIGVITNQTHIEGNKTIEELKNVKMDEIKHLNTVIDNLKSEISELSKNDKYIALKENLLNQKEILANVKEPTFLNKNYTVPVNTFEHMLRQCNQSYDIEKRIKNVKQQANTELADKNKTINDKQYEINILNMNVDSLKRELENKPSHLDLIREHSREKLELENKYKNKYNELAEENKELKDKYSDFEDTIKNDKVLRELFVQSQFEKMNNRDLQEEQSYNRGLER